MRNRFGFTRAKLTRPLAELLATPGAHHLNFDEVRGGVTHASVILDVRDLRQKTESNHLEDKEMGGETSHADAVNGAVEAMSVAPQDETVDGTVEDRSVVGLP